MSTYRSMLENKQHPFHKLIDFNEDASSFTGFDGKIQKAYSEDRNLPENIARELIAQTYLSNNKGRYATEIQYEDKNRADLVARLSQNRTGAIAEVKVVDSSTLTASKFSRLIKDTFNQTDLYINHIDNDIYVTVVFVDLNKVINEPILFTKYHNKSAKDKIDALKVFKETGIYIETKRYHHVTEKLDDKVYYHFPEIVMLEKHVEPLFGVSRLKAKMGNAVSFPSTSSDAYGIKNVRDVKDHEIYTEKKDLTLGILDTCLTAFEAKNSRLIASSGKSKDFLLSIDDTIYHTIKYPDYEEISIVTMNGAIVDGQNSLDSFKYIIETIQDIMDKKEATSQFNNRLRTKIKDKLKSIEEFKEFHRFIGDAKVNIELDTAKTPEEARDISITKNKTMLVSKNELKSSASNVQIPIQVISSDLMEKFGTLLKHQKQVTFFSEQIKEQIGNEELVKILHNMNEESKPKLKATSGFSNSNGINLIRNLSGKTKPNHYNVLTDEYSHEDKTQSSKEIEKLTKDISEINSHISNYKDRINDLKDLPANDEIVNKIEQIEDEMFEERELLKVLQSKKKACQRIFFASKNIDQLNAIIYTINMIKKVVREKKAELNKKDPDACILLNNYIKKYTHIHVLGMLMIKNKKASKKNIFERNNFIKLTEQDVAETFDKMIEGFKAVKENFNVTAVQLKNSGNEEQEIHCVDNKKYMLEDVRGVYLNV